MLNESTFAALQELASLAYIEFVSSIGSLQKLDLEPAGMPEKSELIRELLRISREVIVMEHKKQIPMTERSCFLHPDIRPRVREIGIRMWEITKDNDPDFMCWFTQCDLLSIPKLFRAELNYAWNGIGFWKA